MRNIHMGSDPGNELQVVHPLHLLGVFPIPVAKAKAMVLRIPVHPGFIFRLRFSSALLPRISGPQNPCPSRLPGEPGSFFLIEIP